MGIFNSEEEKTEIVDDGKLLLHEEELDIAKERVRAGEVSLRKEIIEEHKSVKVPVKHEEVIIERRAVDREVSDELIGEEEAIRIPVSKEKLEVGKHTVVTGEVAAFKREVEDTEEINEVLKREEARVDTEGDPNIIASERQLH